jgi:ATP-binding cassette subfamily B protein
MTNIDLTIAQSIRALWKQLSYKRKLQYIILLFLMLLNAASEMVSLGATVPFLTVILNANENVPKEYSKYFDFLSIDLLNENSILFFSILFIFLTILAGFFRVFLLWFGTKLAFATGADLSSKIYSNTLSKSYLEHVNENSSEVVSNLINSVNGVVFWTILPLINLISSIILIGCILTTLFFISFQIALTACLFLAIFYGIIIFYTKRKLKENSQIINVNQSGLIKTVQEGLGSIRDIIIDKTGKFYLESFKEIDLKLRYAHKNNIVIGGFPRPVMETIAIIIMAALMFFLKQSNGNPNLEIPFLGALALGAQKLMPLFQSAYNGWSTIFGGHATLIKVIKCLNQKLINTKNKLENQILFNEALTLKNIFFTYKKKSKWIIKNLNLKIKKGARIGIIGSTGCGKSTLLDIIMGLLSPNKGFIFLDKTKISKSNIGSLHSKISHVPQSIFLADKSIAENIALGTPKNKIDYKHLLLCAEKAHLLEFVKTKKNGFETMVGERGIQLSGGQRQRIGIARALYKKAEILIFDEATSALDNQMERKIINSLRSSNYTIIMVAHRLSSLKNCDTVYELHDCRLLKKFKSRIKYDNK